MRGGLSRSLNELLAWNVLRLSAYIRVCRDWKSWILATTPLRLGNVPYCDIWRQVLQTYSHLWECGDV